MKQPFTLILILSVLFCSCVSYYHVASVESTLIIEDSVYVFENDTVRLEYGFWGERGILSFSIFNKTSKPLYIDWKRSAYIRNGNKMDYWFDESIALTSETTTYTYTGPALIPKTGIVAYGVTITSKPERITYIPPKSAYHRSGFTLFNWIKLPADCEQITDSIPKYPENKFQVHHMIYEKNTTPLFFRNFLTLSFSERIENEFYVDNEFYVKEIKEVQSKYFEFEKSSSVDWTVIRSEPYKQPTNFYVKVPKYQNIKSGSSQW